MNRLIVAVLVVVAATACSSASEPAPMDPAEACQFMQEATGRPADEVCDPPLGRRGEPVVVIPDVATEPSITATSPEQTYLDRLAAAGITATDTTGLANAAEGVCSVLDARRSHENLVAAALVISDVDGWTADEAAQIAVTAVRTYCPEHESAITG